jgi:two-component system chemotaxis response regulator CheY
MPEAKTVKTIIADDQPSMRALLRNNLRQMGIQLVTECGDGAEALTHLQLHGAHLVISDLTMPKLDGIGFLRAVRENPDLAKTAFIMLTSHGETNMVQEAVKLRVNNYVVKPFNFGTLKSKIEAVLGPLT